MVTDEWRTPPWLAEALGEFDLDPCSGPGSFIRAREGFSLEAGQNGLELSWGRLGSSFGRRVFCNPPYSKPLPWAKKLSEHQGPWAALVKLDPTTKWWAALMGDPAVLGHPTKGWWRMWSPFRKRIRFYTPEGKPAPSVANFPCALVWGYWLVPEALKQHLLFPSGLDSCDRGA